jgi:putative flippase GtrA
MRILTERGSSRMARRVADLYDRVRHLGPELVKFGIVGGIGTIVDLGGAAVLHSKYQMEPLTAKAISISAAAVLTYLGSRFWTFRHRENQPLLREGGLFVGLNVIGLLIAEGVIAWTTYVLGYKDPIAYNVASLAGTGLGTVFRYFAYRKWVFLAPATFEPVPAMPDFAAYPPWEPLERAPAPAPVRAYSARAIQHPRPMRLSNPSTPNGAVVTPLVTATAPAWPAAQARSAPRPAAAGSRAPGRHRKH